MPIDLLSLLTRRQNKTDFLTPGINGEKPLPVKGPAQPAQPLPTIGGTRPTPAPISGSTDVNDIAAGMGQPLRMGANGAPVNTIQPTAPNVPEGLSGLDFGLSTTPNSQPYDRQTTRYMETMPNGKQVLSKDANTPFEPRKWDTSSPIAIAGDEKVTRDRMNRAAEKQGYKEAFSTERRSPLKSKLIRFGKDVGTGAMNGVRNGGGGNDQNIIGNLIGGAITGGATSIIAPERAAAVRFETWDAPKMRRSEAEAYAREDREAGIDKEKTAAVLNVERAKAAQVQSRERVAKYIDDLKERERKVQVETQDREYKRGQDTLDQKNKDRDYMLKLEEFGDRKGRDARNDAKLTGGDESALKERAAGYATKAFAPDEIMNISKEYEQQAYKSRVSPEDEKSASGTFPDPAALERVKSARAAAQRDAQDTLKREQQRWEQLFLDEERESATSGKPPLAPGTRVKLNQVQQVATAKRISLEDAKRLLRAYGATVQDQY